MRQTTNRRFFVIMAFCFVLANQASAQNLQIQGTIIAQLGGTLYKVDVAAKTSSQLLSGDQVVGHYGPLNRPTFSPDGKRIALVCENDIPTVREIWIADNNGAHPTKICAYMNSSSSSDNVNWCSNGYIYWCEQTNAIYRVNVLTKVKETIWDAPNITGYHSPELYVEDMTVSNDGRFGCTRGSGRVGAFDIVNKQILSYGQGGCSGWISGGGTRIAHPYTCCVAFPAGANSWNTVTAIESLTVSTPPGQDIGARPVMKFLWSPGQPNGNDQMRAVDFRFAKNSDLHVFGIASEANSALGALVYYIPDGTWTNVPLTNLNCGCLWIGPLPAPTESGSKIALSDSALCFSNQKLIDTITVTNGGTGSLSGALTITYSASWLTATELSSTGASRIIVFTAQLAGLAAGTYRTNVAISGAGAGNAPTIAITLITGSSLTAPSEVSTTKDSLNRVTVRWTDNSLGEIGFAVERTSGTAFVEIGRTLNSATSLLDTTARLVPNVYSYRVRAYDATSYSGYSDAAQISIAAASLVKVTYPTHGVTVVAGSVLRIKWTAVNITAAILEMSADNGRTWTRITTNAAVFETDTQWGNYPWTVPLDLSGDVLVSVSDYNNKSLKDISSFFKVVPVSGAVVMATARKRSAGITEVRRVRAGLSIAGRVQSPSSDATIWVVGLDGRLLSQARVHADEAGNIAWFFPAGRGVAVVRMATRDRAWTSTVLTQAASER